MRRSGARIAPDRPGVFTIRLNQEDGCVGIRAVLISVSQAAQTF